MKHLHERMDDIFAKGNPWAHRTLRTLFDPASSEWDMTSMEEKVTILRKLKAYAENLTKIGIEYRRFYKEDMNRPDIASDFCKGLLQITEFMLERDNAN